MTSCRSTDPCKMDNYDCDPDPVQYEQGSCQLAASCSKTYTWEAETGCRCGQNRCKKGEICVDDECKVGGEKKPDPQPTGTSSPGGPSFPGQSNTGGNTFPGQGITGGGTTVNMTVKGAGGRMSWSAGAVGMMAIVMWKAAF